MRLSLRFPPFIGGLENHVYYLSKYQAEKYFDVTVVIPRISAIKQEDFSVQRLPIVPMIPTAGYSIWKKIQAVLIALSFILIGGFFCFLKKNRVDLYHLHGDWTMVSLGVLLKFLTKKPIVITIHADNRGGIRRLSRKLYCFPFRFLDLIIAVSPSIRKSLLIDRITTKVMVESSGIELQSPSSALSEKLAESVLFVGRIRPMKGVEYLVAAAPLVLESKPKTCFIVVGDGPNLSKVKTLAQSLGVSDHFHFMGALPHSVVREMYQKHSVFVLPSISTGLETEGTPTSILEAMAAGIPIVATQVSAMGFLRSTRKQMFIVEQKDHVSLATGIVSALNSSPDEILAKTTILEEWVKQKSWRKVSKRISTTFMKILEKKVPTRAKKKNKYTRINRSELIDDDNQDRTH